MSKEVAILIEAPPNRRESPAKSSWFIGFRTFEVQISGSPRVPISAASFLLRESTIRIYRNGDNGQPYLKPR